MLGEENWEYFELGLNSEEKCQHILEEFLRFLLYKLTVEEDAILVPESNEKIKEFLQYEKSEGEYRIKIVKKAPLTCHGPKGNGLVKIVLNVFPKYFKEFYFSDNLSGSLIVE